MAKIIRFDESRKARQAEQSEGSTRNSNNGKRRRDIEAEGKYQQVTASERYAASAFRQELAKLRRPYKMQLPAEFERKVFEGDDRLVEKAALHVESLPKEKKGELLFQMIRAAHDGWVRDNPRYFFDASYAEQRYLFLPIELCGLDAYLSFQDLIMRPMHLLGLDYSWMSGDSSATYLAKRRRYIRDRGLCDDSLADYIRNLGSDYPALPAEISNALRTDAVMVGDMAKQASAHGPGGDIELW